MYEVKTKANMEKVESALKWNNIQGGSFLSWCELMNSLHPSKKKYLVILPRKFTINRKLEKGELSQTHVTLSLDAIIQ